ncbi:MAG: site-2 protease family protein [Turicibacter sp.]|nr:site-2 protease family protein [Turicibacter sp.]
MIGLLSTIFVLGTGILIHEIGHFIAARRFGILCHEFAIGMGPAIFKKKIGETVYSLRCIPIGGYVLMAGEDAEKEMLKPGQKISLGLNPSGVVDTIYPATGPGDVTGSATLVDVYENLQIGIELESGEQQVYQVAPDAFYVNEKDKLRQQISPYARCLESKSKLERVIVLAAGAMMNFILAFVFVLLVGLIQGEPVMTNQLQTVDSGLPAYEAGLRPGDAIIQYGNTPVGDGAEIIRIIRSYTEPVEVIFLRDGAEHTVTLVPNIIETTEGPVAQIGIRPLADYHFSVAYAFMAGWAQYRSYFSQMLMTFEMLFVTHEAGVGDLTGPVGIFMMTSQVAALGIFPVLLLAGLINVNLGLLNLLPLPALDGGRIVFILIELIFRRPIPRKFEGYVHMAGFLLFAGLMVFVFFNDISRIMG